MMYEYDNIMNLAEKSNYKQIIIMRDSWNYGNWCIVHSVHIKPDGYGWAYGFIQYADGNKYHGQIPCSGTYAWRIVKILEDKEMNVKRISVEEYEQWKSKFKKFEQVVEPKKKKQKSKKNTNKKKSKFPSFHSKEK